MTFVCNKSEFNLQVKVEVNDRAKIGKSFSSLGWGLFNMLASKNKMKKITNCSFLNNVCYQLLYTLEKHINLFTHNRKAIGNCVHCEEKLTIFVCVYYKII